MYYRSCMFYNYTLLKRDIMYSKKARDRDCWEIAQEKKYSKKATDRDC
jgi:hypothetical protein